MVPWFSRLLLFPGLWSHQLFRYLHLSCPFPSVVPVHLIPLSQIDSQHSLLHLHGERRYQRGFFRLFPKNFSVPEIPESLLFL